MAGVLLGIARHAFPKAPPEVLPHAAVTCAGGVEGDFRGAARGVPYRRQVTLIEHADWAAALAALGADLPWQARRANLLVDGIDLPQRAGARLRIGGDVVLEITRECDPCARMDALLPGLRAALAPDWRGGACAKVVGGGFIVAGDTIRIEEPCPSQSPSPSERSTTSAMSRAAAFSSARI